MSYRNAYYNAGSAARKINRGYAEREFTVVSRKKTTKQFSPAYAIMIAGAIVLMALVAMSYVSLQSDVTNLRKEKSQLLSQYESLRISNDLYYENMMGAIDLKEVEKVAVEELGMKMAGKGQVITYEDELDDYVKQYEDVPAK